MDAPLGRAVGNALEIVECLETLKGNGPAALEALCVALAARLVRLGNAAPDLSSAERRVRSALASGQALETLRKVIERQGGDPAVVDDYTRLPRAVSVEVITATRAGVVASVDAMAVGRASMALGAGRDRVDATIDPGAGIIVGAQPGDTVEVGAPLFGLHVGRGRSTDEARRLLQDAAIIADTPVPAPRIVIDVVTQAA